MTIVQNFLTIPISIDPNNKRISLVHDALKDKKITAIYLMGSDISAQITDPENINYWLQVQGIIGTSDLYLNLFDINSNHCVKDLSFNLDNFLMTPYGPFTKYEINKVIDTDKSYISYNISNSPDIQNLLLLVIYQTENYTQVTDEVYGSYSIDVNPTIWNQNILLKDYVGDRLNGKKIKRIICNPMQSGIFAYLDIFTKCGKRVEKIPVHLLRENGDKTVYFDNIEIDWDKSYYKQRGAYYDDMSGEDYLTKQTLTFIY